jgi:hypothetical protein
MACMRKAMIGSPGSLVRCRRSRDTRIASRPLFLYCAGSTIAGDRKRVEPSPRGVASIRSTLARA